MPEYAPLSPYTQAFIQAMDHLPPGLAVRNEHRTIDVDETAKKIALGAKWILAERRRQLNRPGFGEGLAIGVILGAGVMACVALMGFCVYIYTPCGPQ